MGRDGREGRRSALVVISTHAPLWGATQALAQFGAGLEFQPTRPYGARLSRIGYLNC